MNPTPSQARTIYAAIADAIASATTKPVPLFGEIGLLSDGIVVTCQP